VATNTWSSAGSTDGNLGTNWSLGSISATDDLSFDGTSTVNCTFTATVSVATITKVAAYSGTINNGGFNITTSGNQTYDGTGAVVYSGGTVTITGNGSLHYGSTLTTLTGGGANIDLQGTGNLDIDILTASLFNNVTVGYTGKTTTNTGDSSSYPNMSGVLTINGGAFNPNKYWHIKCNNANPISIVGGSTIGGVTGISFAGGTRSTVNIPAISSASNLVFYSASTTNAVTFSLGGAVSAFGYQIYSNHATNGTTFTTNGYSVTATGGSTSIGTQLGTLTINLGASSWSPRILTTNSWETGTSVVINWGTSQTSLPYSVTIGAKTTNNFTDTSSITITNDSTLTTNGKSLYDLTYNASGKTLTLGSDVSCHIFTLTAGTVSYGAYTITEDVSSASSDSSSTVSASSSTVSASSSTVSASSSTVSASSSTVSASSSTISASSSTVSPSSSTISASSSTVSASSSTISASSSSPSQSSPSQSSVSNVSSSTISASSSTVSASSSTISASSSTISASSSTVSASSSTISASSSTVSASSSTEEVLREESAHISLNSYITTALSYNSEIVG
jgi:hypothetical protein